jgi:hypothetical protein
VPNQGQRTDKPDYLITLGESQVKAMPWIGHKGSRALFNPLGPFLTGFFLFFFSLVNLPPTHSVSKQEQTCKDGKRKANKLLEFKVGAAIHLTQKELSR